MKSLHKRGLQLARVSELSPLHTPWPEHIQQTTQRCPKCKLGAGEQVVMKEPENLAPNSASCPPKNLVAQAGPSFCHRFAEILAARSFTGPPMRNSAVLAQSHWQQGREERLIRKRSMCACPVVRM